MASLRCQVGVSGLKDLIRWDYYHPAEDAEKDLDDGPEIEDAFDDDLAAEASNSLSLRVAPQLVESHKRALAGDENYRERRQRHKEKARKKSEGTKLKRALRQQR